MTAGIDPAILAEALGPEGPMRRARRAGLVLIEDETGAEQAAEIALQLLACLAAAGCTVESSPPNGRSLLRRLWQADRTEEERETLPLPDYARWLATLPKDDRDAVARAWRNPEADPLFRPGTLDCGHFFIPAVRLGHAAVAIWSLRDRPGRVPPHGHLAAVAWLQEAFRAQTVLMIDGRKAPKIASRPF